MRRADDCLSIAEARRGENQRFGGLLVPDIPPAMLSITAKPIRRALPGRQSTIILNGKVGRMQPVVILPANQKQVFGRHLGRISHHQGVTLYPRQRAPDVDHLETAVADIVREIGKHKLHDAERALGGLVNMHAIRGPLDALVAVFDLLAELVASAGAHCMAGGKHTLGTGAAVFMRIRLVCQWRRMSTRTYLGPVSQSHGSRPL